MFGTRWRLFRLLGIPISMDASWLIILALLTLSFAEEFPTLLHSQFPGAMKDLTVVDYWIMGFITALAFFACILLHELGHAVVARSRGMRINGITLFLFGGVAELGEEPSSAATEFLMAIAGPIVSFALAVLFWMVAAAGYNAGWSPPIVIVLGYLGIINAIVLAFNMIPAFPLDGGRVLRSLLWGISGKVRKATFWAALAGQAFAWMLIAWGIVQFFSGNWLGGVWTGLIGLFLNSAAQGGYRQVIIRQALQGEPLRRFMNTNPIAVPPSLDLRHWVEDYIYRYHRKTFPVVADGHLIGYADTQALSRIPRTEWDMHTVSEIMRNDLQAITVSPDTDALTALSKMQRNGVSRLLVSEGDHLVGIVSLKDLLRFLDLKLHLEGADGNGKPSNGTPVSQSRRPVPPAIPQ